MGLLSGVFGSGDLPRVVAPGEEFTDRVSAIAHLVSAQRGIAESWATFEAETGAGTQWTVQVAGETVNLLLTPVDVAALLEGLGLTALAGVARKGGRRRDDATVWELPDSTPEEMGAVVDAVFAGAFGLGEGYRLRGWVER